MEHIPLTKDSKMVERRQYHRARISLVVTLNKDQQYYQCHSLNISANGISVIPPSKHDFVIGDLVNVQIQGLVGEDIKQSPLSMKVIRLDNSILALEFTQDIADLASLFD